MNTLLGRVFAERHGSGRTDLEAVEMALRSGMHHAGAVALTELLQFAQPSADQRSLASRVWDGWPSVLPFRPSVSFFTTGTPVPSIST